jgi:hypothetical protein
MHLGTVQAVSFSADPDHGGFPRHGLSEELAVRAIAPNVTSSDVRFWG